MRKTRKATRHAELYARLVKRFSAGSPEDLVPTVAELKETYGVSQATVTSALRRLQQKGLIRRPPGRKRYVVAKKTPLTQASVAVLRPSWPSPEYDSLLAALQSACARRRWVLELIHHQNWGDVDLVRIMDEHQGILSIGAPEEIPQSHEEHVRKQRYPFVLMMDRVARSGLTSIDGDDVELGRSAVATLRALGHRRIAVLLNEPQSVTIERRLLGWRQAMEDAGEEDLDALVIDCSVAPGQNSIELGRERLERWMNASRVPFTAIFATAWTGALSVMQVMHDRQIHLPDKCSLLAQGGLWPIGKYLVPPLSTIDYDARAWAEAACELLAEQMESPRAKARHLKLPSQVHLRGTTARLRE